MTTADRPFADLWSAMNRLARTARERAAQLSAWRVEPTRRRPHQELAETAMALLTLWTTYDDDEADEVAATTRTLLAGHNAEELGYLVLHMAGLSRGLSHVMLAQREVDINEALQTLGRDIQERRAAG